ncbi:adenosine deaminase family protein [Coraliomargarita parva]|uniref:adenosine deaminase family protein n=1 Tax=Coraliomargarita parva TaxID=3014050 RepID=UPI0022B50027|nr:adenosine deaminase family protein [Coraliomargarita parva]
MYTPNPDLKEFVQSLPKTETHLHLEGACPYEMIQRTNPEKYRTAPPMWDDSFRYDSFDQFMDMYAEFCAAVFTSAEAYHECAKKILQNCADQNCRYVETSFHIASLFGGTMSGPELVQAVLDAAPKGLEVRVFMGMCHNDYTGIGKTIIDDCIKWEKLSGVDIHGPEYIPMEPWTKDIWQKAADAGKILKAHAGEFMPASFVRYCIEELNVRRIQHGVRCIEDPSVVDLILEKDVTLDVCPISNVKLQVEGVTDMAHHPIRKLFDAGVRCTVNSDDPFMFGNSLSEDYYGLATDLGFTHAELARLARNGFEIADWESPERKDCIRELDAIAGSGRSL